MDIKTVIVPTEKQISDASAMLKLTSDPTRLKILWALLHGEHSVNELAEHVGAQPGAVSQHLAKLRAAQVVEIKRDGNKIFYKTDNKYIRKAIEYALLFADVSIKRN